MSTQALPFSGFEAAAHADGGVRPAFQVIIAHDDFPAYVRAVRMLANTFFGHPEAENLRLQPWRFDDLGREAWRRRATTEAAETDVFVVSTTATGELPEVVQRWLAECAEVRHEQPTAVVALCDALNDLEVPWRRRLRQAAEVAGWDFLEASLPAALQRAS